MLTRFAFALLVAGAATSPARAADLIEAPPTDCNCGSSGMITIYDFEPGVVTRHWSTVECQCRSAPLAKQSPLIGGPVNVLDNEPFADPWRRW
jgi:hypothetical protein